MKQVNAVSGPQKSPSFVVKFSSLKNYTCAKEILARRMVYLTSYKNFVFVSTCFMSVTEQIRT